ncbi:uncharacterized protein K02A2.6-like [Belonocnema kinseyi]|uniref:uncharacterized protein K02A2.6-like n=1 Tax=Belonocnema kinseyi TaxID=2817044 RepID=UPI00143D289C|nr:uncharacterized protein K02A2.6-like [Belonocnema kinseyi]
MDHHVLRWAYFLSGFRYKIETIKSEQNGNCDALSRLPICDDTNVFGADFTPIYNIKENVALDWQAVQRETKTDELLSKIMKFCTLGWPSSCKNSADITSSLFAKRHEISIEDGCLFWGNRIIIPESLQLGLIKEFHASHLGIIKMKAWARSYVWWPNIDIDLENAVKSCDICLKNPKNPPHAPLTPWPWPHNVWKRIHLDFLGPFYGNMYLVVIDAHSKWPEFVGFGNNTKASALIDACQVLFARYGLPRHVVSDNGPQFTAADFKEFLEKQGVKQSFSPPYHPPSNGAAENFVGTFKNKVAKLVEGKKSVKEAINIFLFDYRSSPHCTTGKSPACLFYKRELRTRFDKLRSRLADKVQTKQQAQVDARPHSRNVVLEPGDAVWVDNHPKTGGKRVEAEIAKALSPSTFEVQLKSGATLKRHTDQIVKPTRRSAIIANRKA